jgi:hypothetical protein
MDLIKPFLFARAIAPGKSGVNGCCEIKVENEDRTEKFHIHGPFINYDEKNEKYSFGTPKMQLLFEALVESQTHGKQGNLHLLLLKKR